MRLFQFFIYVFSILCFGAPAAIAQPDTEIESFLLTGNKLFQEGEYEEALANYKAVIAKQPSNNYVRKQITKANEEMLYAKITTEENPEIDCREYINRYGEEGKYTLKVKNLLGQQFLAIAYKDYQTKNIDALESIYFEYLTLLGTARSNEMKQWLYLLCNEKAESFLENKKWNSAKEYFENSLKYENSTKEFKNAQSGITLASKKKQR